MFRKLILIALAVTATACSLDEPAKDCGVVIVVVKPSFPAPSGEDEAFEEVKGINVYVFDNSTGVLKEIIMMDEAAVKAGELEISTIPNGNYTFVAWGGTRETMDADGFKTVQMEDAARSTYKDGVEIGVTTKDDFYVMINNDSESGNTGTIKPMGEFTDLYYAVSDNVTIDKSVDTRIDFSFVRNTNMLDINISGLEYLSSPSGTPLNIWVEGKNGRYNWANNIDADARTVHYDPTGTKIEGDVMSAQTKILRLELARHLTDPVYVYIEDPSGEMPARRFNILDVIAKEQNKTPEQLTQAFLDEQYSFTLNLTLNVDLTITVGIVEWTPETPTAIF